MIDLTKATTDELIYELERRHQATMIAVLRDDPDGSEDGLVRTSFSGGIYTAIGLAHKAQHRLTKWATEVE